jgi:hypothetical protein
MNNELGSWGYPHPVKAVYSNTSLRSYRDEIIKSFPDMRSFEPYYAKSKAEHEAKEAAAMKAKLLATAELSGEK